MADLVIDEPQKDQVFEWGGTDGYVASMQTVRVGVLNAIEHIEAHFYESISVKDLANIANMSEYHFIRVFKTQTGYSPNQYLIGHRIREACSQLENESFSVEVIAGKVGYESHTHFCRIFKGKVGVSPLQYRKRYQGRSSHIHKTRDRLGVKNIASCDVVALQNRLAISDKNPATFDNK